MCWSDLLFFSLSLRPLRSTSAVSSCSSITSIGIMLQDSSNSAWCLVTGKPSNTNLRITMYSETHTYMLFFLQKYILWLEYSCGPYPRVLQTRLITATSRHWMASLSGTVKPWFKCFCTWLANSVLAWLLSTIRIASPIERRARPYSRENTRATECTHS